MKYLLTLLGLALSGTCALVGAPSNDAFSYATPITVTPSSNAGGMSVGLIVSGVSYRIASVGTTDFTLIGAEANLPGTVFTATAAGPGTGTVNPIASFSGSNVAATAETGEPAHATKGAGHTVWWTWRPLTQGTATITTEGSSFDTVLAVYTGNAPATLTTIAYNDDLATSSTTSKVTFSVRAGETYRIAVDGYQGGSQAPTGTIKLNVALGVGTYVAQNDDYDARAILGGERTIGSGDSQLATIQIAESGSSYYGFTTKSLWWTWTAPRSGLVTITSVMDINAEFAGDYLQALLEIYDSTAESLEELGLPDYYDFSPGFSASESVGITRTVLAGDVLQIRVSSWDAYSGAQVSLRVEMNTNSGVANDRFVKSPRVMGSNAVLSQTNAGAASDPTEPAHYAEVAAGSLVIGERYAIHEIGTTDFTSVGALDNAVGNEFIATGVGSGTGTALLLKPSGVTADIRVRADQLVVGVTYLITTVGSTNWVALGAAENGVGEVFTATAVGTGTGVARVYHAGILTIGKQYRIVTDGSDFTSFGAADNNPGTVFTATGRGSGDGTVLPVEVVSAGSFVEGRIYRIETRRADSISAITDFTEIGAPDNERGTFFRAIGPGTGTGTATMLSPSASVWWTWVAPSNGYVTLDTEGSRFDTVLHVYTGGKLDELVSRASNDDSGDIDLADSSIDRTSRVHFAVVKGTAYRIVVDTVEESRATGDIQLEIRFLPDSPVITTQVLPQIAYLGDGSATFTVVHTGALAAYDWQRKAAGSTIWVHYQDGVVTLPSMPNAETTSTVTIPGPISPGMNGDQFRCVISNVGGQVVSRAATLTVISLSTYVGAPQSVDISMDFEPIPPGTGITYYAKGLPSGLKLNRDTGVISGRLAAKPGTYTVTYWAIKSVGAVKTKTEAYTTVIYVLPFPATMTGRFEGLLTDDDDDLPIGKVELVVSNVGAFSGKFTYQGRVYSLRNVLSLNNALTPTQGRATLKLSDSLTLRLNVRSDSTLLASLTGGVDVVGRVNDGVQLKTYTALIPAPFQRAYTMALSDPERLSGGPAPEGSGYGLVAVNYKGDFRLNGKLADGTVITAFVSSDTTVDGGYRLFIPLYAKKLGHLAGWLPLTPRGVETGLYHSESPDFYWRKPGASKDRTYPVGFLAGVDVIMEPWIAPERSYLIGLLGLLTRSNSQTVGNFEVTMDLVSGLGGVISNDGSNPNELPVLAKMDALSKVSVLSSDPGSGNPTGWRMTINPKNGTFTGSFTLPDKRRVPFTGVLLQLPAGTTDNVFGRGSFLVPPVKTTPATGYIRSGAIEFIGPEIPPSP
jgi:hypothetical protein